jgi:hypothetical protein
MVSISGDAIFPGRSVRTGYQKKSADKGDLLLYALKLANCEVLDSPRFCNSAAPIITIKSQSRLWINRDLVITPAIPEALHTAIHPPLIPLISIAQFHFQL